MKKIFVFTLMLILIFAAASFVQAEENTINIDAFTAKSYSMGGAFTGVADDVSAVIYNPAGLTQSGVVGLQVSSGINNLNMQSVKDAMDISTLMQEDDTSVYDLYDAFPDNIALKGQGFAGVNVNAIGISGNLSSSFSASKGDGSATMNNYNDVTGILSIGKDLTSTPAGIGSLSYGLNLKMAKHYYNHYELDTSAYEKTIITANANSIGIDVGALAKLTDIFTMGAQVKNVYATDYTFEGEKEVSHYDGSQWIVNSTGDYVGGNTYKPDRTMRVGASVEVPVISTTLAADIENVPPLSQNEDMIYHLGVQQNLLLNLISLRAGTYGYLNDINGKDSAYTFGAGINLAKLHMSAAIGTSGSFEDNITGIISGRFKF